MTYDELVELALQLPGVEESTQYREPAVKRDGRVMFGLRKENRVSMKLDWESRDRFLEEDPATFLITPHYYGWPWLLVELDQLTPERAKEILELSWEDAPKKGKRRAAP